MDARFFPSGVFAAVAEPSQVEPPVVTRPLHDPPLSPRDEAVFLLTAVAEIEHALMVQYLYAAYSIKVPDQESVQQGLQDMLVEIAREEMGHLITVQNLLHLVGGPLNLGRDSGPYGSAIYPFQFRLEPLTTDSLAKYVTAESPDPLPHQGEVGILSDLRPDGLGVLSELTRRDRELILRLRETAKDANDGKPVRQIGPLFQRLLALFGDEVDGITDDDFRTDTHRRQAQDEDWGYDTLDPAKGRLIVGAFTDPNVPELRAKARAALTEIAEQGEGVGLGARGESHFERFFAIYKAAAGLLDSGVQLTWPITSDPNTSADPGSGVVDETPAATGRIREPRARAWAQMFNLRYRMLLGQLAHFLHLDQELYVDTEGPQLGDRTARGLLLLGAFDEMRHLRKIAAKLVTLRKDEGGVLHAAPPFELPYTLNLPDGENARWRTHLDVSRAAVRLAQELVRRKEDDPFLTALTSSDLAAQKILQALAAGGPIPPGALPTGFVKAVTILDEAVRGFRVAPERCRHAEFWAGATRDTFVKATAAGVPVLLDRDGNVVKDPEKAELIRRMTRTDEECETGTDCGTDKDHRTRDDRGANRHRRMPLMRPPVPEPRLQYLKQWISDGAPDGEPRGATFEKEPEPSPPPEIEITGGPVTPVDPSSRPAGSKQ